MKITNTFFVLIYCIVQKIFELLYSELLSEQQFWLIIETTVF